MSDDAKKKFRVKIGPARMSFPSLIKPRRTEGDDGKVTEKFELTLLVPPDVAPKAHADALRVFTEMMTEKHGSDQKKWPKLRRKPKDVLIDFEAYNADSRSPLPDSASHTGNWKGWMLVRANASTKYPPGVVGPQKESSGKFPVIVDEREVYGGRWCNAVVEAYYYGRQDGNGVTLGLSNVQLLKHDKKFGGAVTAAEEVFDNASDEWAGSSDAFDSGEVTKAATSEADPWN